MTDTVPEGHSVEDKNGSEEERITVKMQSHCFVFYSTIERNKRNVAHFLSQCLPPPKKTPQGCKIQWDVYPPQRLSQQNGDGRGREGMELVVTRREGCKNAAVSNNKVHSPLVQKRSGAICRPTMK